ncbi:MAG: carboxypeptidase-like regulatory domain-containing protein [Chthoniobacteraceae bacterium]
MNTLKVAVVSLLSILPFPAGFAGEPAPVPASTGTGSIIIYRAATPDKMWDGWGYSSPANPDQEKEAVPVPEQFDKIQNEGKEPRTFSGKVVGLVSLVGTHWVNKEAYQWQPVAADGSFSMVDARYLDAGKALVLRGPDTAWSFLRYDFAPGESGSNIALKPVPSKKVRLTAGIADREELAKMQWEVFPAHTQYNDKGLALRRERLGKFDAADKSYVEAMLPLGEVALYITNTDCAAHYQIIDTRKGDHFHFVLKPAGHLKITALDGDGKPKVGVHASWINPAAPLSISQRDTGKDGAFVADGLVPGTFHVTIADPGWGTRTVEIKEGSTTEIHLQDGDDPVVSQTEPQPVKAAAVQSGTGVK